MSLSTVKKRLEAKQSLCYQSTAELVSDIRLILGNCAVLSSEVKLLYKNLIIQYCWALCTWPFFCLLACQTVPDVSVAGTKLMQLFEEHLRIIFCDQTFPEIKMEMIPAAPPPYSQVSSLDNTPQPAKRQRICSDSQDAPSCPSGGEGAAWKHIAS